jgi:hypothetical protein
LLLAGAWWLWRNRQSEPRIAQVPLTPAPTATQSAPTVSPSNVDKHNQNDRQPSGRKDSGSSPSQIAQNNQKSLPPNAALVERSFLPSGGGEDDNATRGANRNLGGKTLHEVRRVYLQATADNEATRKLLVELQGRLGNGILTVSAADNAEAAVKISAQRASDQPDDPRVVAIVRAVNADGRVVWPDSRRKGSWKYIGEPRFVAERIASDLTKAVRR